MSKNNVAIRAISKLPAAVKRFWGPPPIYRTEKEEDYWIFAAAIAHDLDPTDSIMMMYRSSSRRLSTGDRPR